MNSSNVLIVAPSGRLRDSLRALLIAMSEIDSVQVADDVYSALRSVQEHHPTVVLIDMAGQEGAAWVISRQIKAHWPYVRRILVVQREQQRRHTGGDAAEAVLVKGFSAAKLFDTVSEQLSDPLIREEISGVVVQSAGSLDNLA